MTGSNHDIGREAQILTRYLIKEKPREKEVSLYATALSSHDASLTTKRDEHLWQLMMRNPSLIGIVDAGLALTDPHSNIRRRIFLMLSILEASPGYAATFMRDTIPVREFVTTGVKVCWGVTQAIIGYVFIRTASLLWR